ncbi:HlyC/CorC family transporter [Candidatus Woesearchaeota archaeon]|nr:HlyC/CorC family transporter [Candidatus Woesearchaeota archaeon]
MVFATSLIIAFVILVLLSAFFSAVETAVYSINDIKIRELVNKKARFSETLARLKHQRHKFLSTILIGNNLVNITASVIATKVTIILYGDQALGILTGVLTFIMLVIGEFIPKTIATVHPEFVALNSAPLIDAIMIVFMPFVYFFDLFSKLLLRLMGKKKYHEEITEDTIRSVVESGEEQGIIKTKDKKIINNILKFNRINIKDIMIPKKDIVALHADTIIKDIIDEIIHENYSRIPIYEGKLDNIVGVLYIKDLLKAIREKRIEESLKTIAKKPYFISENKRLDGLFSEFQNKKVHIAIVLNKVGRVIGLVTMEDLLEEIFGEIYDESDFIEWKIRKINPKVYLIKGNTTLNEINEKLGIKLPGKDKNQALRGFIFEKINKIPQKGCAIKYTNYKLVINRVLHHRIIDVRLVKK